jgi:hypothetical protein
VFQSLVERIDDLDGGDDCQEFLAPIFLDG